MSAGVNFKEDFWKVNGSTGGVCQAMVAVCERGKAGWPFGSLVSKQSATCVASVTSEIRTSNGLLSMAGEQVRSSEGNGYYLWLMTCEARRLGDLLMMSNDHPDNWRNSPAPKGSTDAEMRPMCAPGVWLAFLIFSARWRAFDAFSLHCAWKAGVAAAERERWRKASVARR